MKLPFRYIFIFLSFFVIVDGWAQGLLFEKKIISDRSSYMVFKEDKSPLLSGKFKMDFELSIRCFHRFGYVFSLKNKSQSLFYSLTFTYLNDKQSVLNFNTDGRTNHFSVAFNNIDLKNKWIPISLEIDLEHDKAEIKINEKSKIIDSLGAISPFKLELFFGKNDYILDIPNFAIRNLKISDNEKEYIFPLNESQGSDVHDIHGEVLGHVTNPYWLINDSFHWKLISETTSLTPSGIAYNEEQQCFYIFNQDSLLNYDIEESKLFSYSYNSSLPVKMQLGTHFINKKNNELYVYELNNLPVGDITVASLDSSYMWRPIGTAALPVQLHHHIGFWNDKNDKYCIFGGFGNQKYNNTFLTYAVEADKWDTLHFSGYISPRYFSSMVSDKSGRNIFIYGGMGNESGEQSIGRNYYHDLYKVNLDSSSIVKLWGGITPFHRVPVRSMILSSDEEFIYLIIYPEYLSKTYLQLYKMSIKTGNLQAVADSIPMISNEIATNANLFYNEKKGEFYCSIQEYTEKNNVTTRIYSLVGPPVSSEDMNLYVSSLEKRTLFDWLLILLPISMSFIVCGILFFRKKKNNIVIKQEEDAYKDTPITIENVKNTIYLFGSFTVFNRNGIDITHLLTPRIRQVFIYILLNSKNNGVLSNALNEVFWRDKSDDKVKNLKGVTMKQIRNILSEIDGIELVYDKGYFKVNIDETVCYCDYVLFSYFMDSSKSITKEQIYVILLRGKFLLGESMSVFDLFKTKVDDYLYSYLPLEIDYSFKEHDYENVVRLCNILLSIDSLNELSLSYIIYTLNILGNTQEAILRYSSFVKEYKHIMGEEFMLSYNELIKKVPSV